MAKVTVARQQSKGQVRQHKSTQTSFWNQEISFSQGIGTKDKKEFFKILEKLLSSGLNITESLDIITQETRKKKPKGIYESILKQVSEGNPFSDALAQFPDDFEQFEVYSVRMGEQTGRMAEVLKRLADYHEKRYKLKKKVMQALSYPIVVIMIAVGVMVFMMGFVVPMFEGMFDQFDAELPAITQFVLSVSEFFRDMGLWLLLVIIILTIFIIRIRKRESFKRISSLVINRIPIFGKVIRKINLARFCYSFGLMLESKVTMDQTLDLMEAITDYYPIKRTIPGIRKKVLEGEMLFDGIKDEPIYPAMMKQMIRVGENTAQLEEMILEVAKNLEEESEAGVTTLTNLLEPILILLLGVMVGVILVSMYLPMFELSNVISG